MTERLKRAKMQENREKRVRDYQWKPPSISLWGDKCLTGVQSEQSLINAYFVTSSSFYDIGKLAWETFPLLGNSYMHNCCNAV